MQIFKHGSKGREPGAGRTGRRIGKRLFALALTLGILLELSGAAPGLLLPRGLSPLVTEVSAAGSIEYAPTYSGLAMIPSDKVLPIKKLLALEAKNPSLELNINSQFQKRGSSNLYSDKGKSLGGEFSGSGGWSAKYTWNPAKNKWVKSHLEKDGKSLELFWTGSGKRAGDNNPGVKLWYNANHLLVFPNDKQQREIYSKNAYQEIQSVDFNKSASGTVTQDSTKAIPLCYTRRVDEPVYGVVTDENGDWVWEDVWDSASQCYHSYAVTELKYNRGNYPFIVGGKLKTRVSAGNVYEQEEPVWLEIYGGSDASISNTKMRLRDTQAPYLTGVTLKKNQTESVTDSVYLKTGDTLDIVLTFNEEIRFADNNSGNHNLGLRMSYVDASNGASDSDSWVKANLVSLKGKTMTFRLDVNNISASDTGKGKLPAEFYIDSIAGVQSGWYSNRNDFPLSLIDAGNHTISTGEGCKGVVTDIAGNPFTKFNITRFSNNVRANFDIKNPTIFRTIIWTANLSEAEASIGSNINETDPNKLFVKVGDRVSLKVIFSEELASHTIDGADLAPVATLNVRRGNEYVTLDTAQIYTVDSKSIDVNAPQRLLTVIEFKPLYVYSNTVLDGNYIAITGISGLADMCDLALNPMNVANIPKPQCEQKIDVTPPTVTIGAALDDGLDPDVFTIPISISDADSGVAGNDFRFRLTNDGSAPNYMWTVDRSSSILRRESDNTADTTGWKAAKAGKSTDNSGWFNVTPPVGSASVYLHVKLLNPETWDCALSDIPIEGGTDLYKTTVDGNVEVQMYDIKNNLGTGSEPCTHVVGYDVGSEITFGGVTYADGKAVIPVTVTNPIGVQKVVYGTSLTDLEHTVYSNDLNKSYTFDYIEDTSTSGTVNVFVAAFGPDGSSKIASVSYSYDFEAGALSYKKSLGEETKPLFGLPTVNNMAVTDEANNRTMVLLDKGDGTFFATTGRVTGSGNLFAADSGLSWYSLTGTAAPDYSSLTVTGKTAAAAEDVAAWVNSYYGRLPVVLLIQNNKNYNGSDEDDCWYTLPGSYSDNKGIVAAVEYAYLANEAEFTVSSGVYYSKTSNPVSDTVLHGSPDDPHYNIADYSFKVNLTNVSDAASNQSFYQRIVSSAEAEIMHKGSSGDYETVRTVAVPVGDAVKVSFAKEDSVESGWYKVVYRYTVNGVTHEAIVAEGIYLDNTATIEPDVVSYKRSFDMYVREPEWRYGTYYVGYSKYSHANSAAADDDIEDGEIVNIGVAPVAVPEDKLPGGAQYLPLTAANTINTDSRYLDRYYLIDNDTNILTFSFTKTDPETGTADMSRIGGVNYFYAWSGNDPSGRENALAARQEFTADQEVVLAVTDGGADGYEAADYAVGKLPLSEGYNLIHYVVQYKDGEEFEKTFMADVRTTTMDLGLDVYYHEPDKNMDEDMMKSAMLILTDDDGNLLYDSAEEITAEDLAEYAASIGAVKQVEPLYMSNNGTWNDPTDDYLVTEVRYTIAGEKCWDETDLLHRKEAVVNPVLSDYDNARAYSFRSYKHLDKYKDKDTGEVRRADPDDLDLYPMMEERFRKSSDSELFFAEDVYGNVTFASTPMDAIDGEAPMVYVSTNFNDYGVEDVLRSGGSYTYTYIWPKPKDPEDPEDPEETEETEEPKEYTATGDLSAGFDFLLNMLDDSPLDLSTLTVSFDPAYSKVLDPTLDGETDQFTVELPLNFEKDEYGYYIPWEISESEAGKTGGITMTCLKSDTEATPGSITYMNIEGVEIQGVFLPCTGVDKVTMTFHLTDVYGNSSDDWELYGPTSYQPTNINLDEYRPSDYPRYLEIDTKYDDGRMIVPENYTLREGADDNTGWYEGYVEYKADGTELYPYFYNGIAELPDWAPEPVYDTDRDGNPINLYRYWGESVSSILPELDMYETGRYFTNEGYIKLGVVQPDKEIYYCVPYAVSVESYQTDYGVFTDGYVRTRTFQKLTGRYGQSSSYYQTEQAIILPGVKSDGDVTVNWTDVFGKSHSNIVTITAFGASSDEKGVRAGFSANTMTNEDVLVALKGSRTKDENGKTITAEITGVTVTLRDGAAFDQTDSRVTIYESQPWNATVLMPDNGSIAVEYRVPHSGYNDEKAAEAVQTDLQNYIDNYSGSKPLTPEKIEQKRQDFTQYYYDVFTRENVESDKRLFIYVSNIDKTPPVTEVTYVYADTGEPVPEDVTSTTREIRADVTADEFIQGTEGGLSCIFTYAAQAGDVQTVTVRDKAGNTVDVTATCPATVTAPAAGENTAPTATVYLAANLGGKAKNLGSFTMYEDGDTVISSVDENGTETTTTVNLNSNTVAAINAAIAKSRATLYTLRFEINDEAPGSCTVASSDPAVAEVGANNTVTVRVNGSFDLTVSDSDHLTSSLTGIVVNALDNKAPAVTPNYGLYYADDGTQRVRVAFRPENDEQIYPIVTGDKTSRDIMSTVYNLYDVDANVIGQRVGYFIDFAANENYTFYYKDAYGNASSVSVSVRGIDTDAPSVLSTMWSGTINDMTPDSVGAGPTTKNVTATITTNKALSSAKLYYYDENAENHVGDPLSAEDAKKVSAAFSTTKLEITWRDNVNSKLIVAAKSADSGLTAYEELPPVTVIDRTGPTVTLNGEPTLSADKSSKEFRFTVTGTAGEVFTSNMAVTYTSVTDADGVETVTRNAVGTKGTEFIYTAKSSVPITLRFSDDAGNTTEFPLTSDMLSGIDASTLSVSFNTSASDIGAKKRLSELTLDGTTVYVFTSKDATVTVSVDGGDYAPVSVTANTWTPLTISDTADMQALKFEEVNTGRTVYEWLVNDTDRRPPAITYTGDIIVFANTGMTQAQIETLLLSDVSATDAVDGSLDHATITVSGVTDAAGLHTVTYHVTDLSDNAATLERYLYVKGPYDPIIKVNGKETVPLDTIVVNTRTITITGTCGLAGDNSVYLEIRPGVMTAARMKYNTASGTNVLNYTAPKDGIYTVLARNRDRTEVLTYICVDTSN